MTHHLRRSLATAAIAVAFFLQGSLSIAQAQHNPYWETTFTRPPSLEKSTVVGEWDLTDSLDRWVMCGWTILQGPQPSGPMLVQNCVISTGLGNGLGQPLEEIAPHVYRLDSRDLRLALQADGRLEVRTADGKVSYLSPTPARPID